MRPRCAGIEPHDLLSLPFVYAPHTAPRGLWRHMHVASTPEKSTSSLPLHVELCTGKGSFLLRASEQYPERLWVGVELAPAPLWKAIRKRERDNCHFLWMNIQNLAMAFAQGEIDRLYLHFCDPWPKRRHALRRVTHPFFLRTYQQCLSPSGDLLFKTDHPTLFSYSLQNLQDEGWKIVDLSRDLYQSPYVTHNIPTEYENRYVRQGLPIFYLRAKSPASV